jgi:hypothetical protein
VLTFIAGLTVYVCPLWSNGRLALCLFHVHVSALVALGYDIAFKLPHIIVTTPAGTRRRVIG